MQSGTPMFNSQPCRVAILVKTVLYSYPHHSFKDIEAYFERLYFTDWLIDAKGYNYPEPFISLKDGAVIYLHQGQQVNLKGPALPE